MCRILKLLDCWICEVDVSFEYGLVHCNFQGSQEKKAEWKWILSRILFYAILLDQDNDNILTEEEFVTLPLGEADDEEQKQADKQWQEERKLEFNNQIDSNHDGKVTLEELYVSVMPA